MLFVDQPVGTGFSYADHGEHVVRDCFLDLGLHALCDTGRVELNARGGDRHRCVRRDLLTPLLTVAGEEVPHDWRVIRGV